MSTPNEFALLLAATGLSHAEAGRALGGMRTDSVAAYDRGHRTPPKGVLDELAELADAIQHAVNEALADLDYQLEVGEAPETPAILVTADDAQAKALGWPCAAAQRQVAGRIAASARVQGVPVHLVFDGDAVAGAITRRRN